MIQPQRRKLTNRVRKTLVHSFLFVLYLQNRLTLGPGHPTILGACLCTVSLIATLICGHPYCNSVISLSLCYHIALCYKFLFFYKLIWWGWCLCQMLIRCWWNSLVLMWSGGLSCTITCLCSDCWSLSLLGQSNNSPDYQCTMKRPHLFCFHL